MAKSARLLKARAGWNHTEREAAGFATSRGFRESKVGQSTCTEGWDDSVAENVICIGVESKDTVQGASENETSAVFLTCRTRR